MSKLSFRYVCKTSFFFFLYTKGVGVYKHIYIRNHIRAKQLSRTFFQCFEKKVFCFFLEYKIVKVTYAPVHLKRF